MVSLAAMSAFIEVAGLSQTQDNLQQPDISEALRLVDHLRLLLSAGGGQAAASPRPDGRYRLVFGGKGLGQAVTLGKTTDGRAYQDIGRIEGTGAVLLQRLAALRSIGGYFSFADTLGLFMGTAPSGDDKALARLAHQKVRTAIHRSLPPGVNHGDIIKSKRGYGYQLCDSVAIAGEFAAEWDPPLAGQARATSSASPSDLDENDRLVLGILLRSASWDDIQSELDLGDQALDQVKRKLGQLAYL